MSTRLFAAVTTLAALFVGNAADAQLFLEGPPTSVTGVVALADFDSDPGSDVCFQPEYTLQCSGNLFFLQSATIDLADFVGQNVKLEMFNPFVSCPTFEVTAVIETLPAALDLCGTPEGLGCAWRVRSSPGGISQHFLFASITPGFAPLAPEKGSFLLGSPFLTVATTVSVDAEGAAFDLFTPGDAALIGLDVWLQAARRDVGPIVAPFALSNSVCFEVVGFVFVCHQPDC